MHLPTIVISCCTLALTVVEGMKLTSDMVKGMQQHHSTKKELKDPHRFPRKTETTAQGDSTDFDPALVYALPPVGLGHRFGYNAGHQGYDAAALVNLVSSGLQEGRTIPITEPKKPVFQQPPPLYTNVLLSQATPIEEPKQEERAQVQAVELQAHKFVNRPQYYNHKEQEDEYKDYAAKYQFGYRVRDLHTGNDFGQTESRDGHLTQGHYHVLLPDGRLQSVHYWSDHSGFHAKVSYDGHSHHP